MRGRVLVLLLVLTAVQALAQKSNFKFIPGPKPGGGEVKITVAPGGTIEAQKDEYSILQGDVTIEYQDIKLRADKVTYNLKTRDVVAEGNVIVDQGPTRITSTQAVYNLGTKTGTFFNASGTMDPSMYFSGDRIEKVDDDTYRLTNGIFTSCDLDRPAWSFHVGHADVTMDDYARLKNLSFRAAGLPIFWAPRLIWPTKRDRSRGFLIPRARFGDKFGTRMESGYFVPLGPSADATIYGELSTTEYFGAGVDLRYVPSENIKVGDLRARIVHNAIPRKPSPTVDDPFPAQPDARVEWRYHFRHAQENLPGGFRGVVDVQDFSDLDFFREYDEDPRVLTLSNIYSSAYLTKNRPTYSLNLVSDRRDIVSPSNARQRFEQLPSLQLRMYPQRVGRTPVYFSMESSSSRLRTGAVTPEGDPTINADYLRTDVFPTVSMRIPTPRWFSLKPQLAVRQTFYSASLQQVCEREGEERPLECAACEANPNLPICTRRELREDEGVTRFYAQGQVETVGPSLSRIFNRSAGGFSRFKHVVEPRVRYVYTSDVENLAEIVRFDTVDSPFLPIVRDSVEYSLTQRLIGKEAREGGSPREVLSFALRQSMALSDPFPRSGSTGAAEHKFTPLFANLRFNPWQAVTVDASAVYGNVSHQVEQVSLSTNLVGTGARSDKYLGFTFFSTFERPGSSSGGSSQIRLNAGSFVIPGKVRADVQLNFDANVGRFLEQRYLTGWTGSCYGIALGYRRYLVFGGEDESLASYDFAVTLKNVGTIGSH